MMNNAAIICGLGDDCEFLRGGREVFPDLPGAPARFSIVSGKIGVAFSLQMESPEGVSRSHIPA